MLKKIPVIVRMSDEDVKKFDLLKELKVDRSILDLQLARQPSKYAYWSQLYATVSAKVAQLREDLENLEAQLYIDAINTNRKKKGFRVTDARKYASNHPKYIRLRARLRRWMDSERYLKFAERAFDQRLSVLMALNANKRRENQNEE